MNPLLAMFVSESRDLLEDISKGLLTLESNPGDIEVMNGIFRALHTLKGSSGLFEPDLLPLTRLSHAGEDLLDAVRNGKFDFTSDMADLLLDSLDSIGYWLDVVEQTDVLPDDAESKGSDLVQKLRSLNSDKPSPSPPPPKEETPAPKKESVSQTGSQPPSWLTNIPDALLKEAIQSAQSGSKELVAIQYLPDSSCFFMGEDPLHLVKQLPDILALHIDSREPFPAAEELDPFNCVLRFQAISQAPIETLNDLFRYVDDQVELTSITVADLDPNTKTTSPANSLSDDDPETLALVQIVQQQWTILSLSCPPQAFQERLEPVVRVLRNCFLYKDLSQELSDLEKRVTEVQEEHSFEPIRLFLSAWLNTSKSDLDLDSDSDLDSNLENVFEESQPIRDLTPQQSTGKTPSIKASSEQTQTQTKDAPGKTLKIDQVRIDKLVDLVGELVVAKNSMPYLAERALKEYGVRPLAQEILEFYGVINRLSDELQTSVMQIRMMPVENVFQRFPRLIRDISRKLNKKIRLITEGGTTEADKNIIEGLSDPLIHLVRNSLDHGIESPEDRIASGKDPQGEIRLTAFQEGDRVVIEIQDDGKGIDPNIIKRKAYEKGIIDESRLEDITDHEAIQLIFAAGFSTADQISDLSGRGVGMDVVRSAVARVGGNVLLHSKLGEWSRVRLELPLTMAVTRVMLIEQGDTMYGIPLDMVVETVRIPKSEIHPIKQSEATVIRGRLLPVLRLRNLLQLKNRQEDEDKPIAILVVKPLAEEIGLVVDNFDRGVDIVIKPLEGILADIPGYSGAALLGDGRVLLVLNLKELL